MALAIQRFPTLSPATMVIKVWYHAQIRTCCANQADRPVLGQGRRNDRISSPDVVSLGERVQLGRLIGRIERAVQFMDTVVTCPCPVIEVTCHCHETNHIGSASSQQRRHGATARIAYKRELGGAKSLQKFVDRLAALPDHFGSEAPGRPVALIAASTVRARELTGPCQISRVAPRMCQGQTQTQRIVGCGVQRWLGTRHPGETVPLQIDRQRFVGDESLRGKGDEVERFSGDAVRDPSAFRSQRISEITALPRARERRARRDQERA